MPKLVTSGAMLKCSLGSVQNQLQIQAASGITSATAPVATIAHAAPGNFRSFGACSAISPPQPCTPAPAGAWTPGSPTVRMGTVPVLNQSCQCQCQRGGVISIVASGQQTTTVAAAGSGGQVNGR